MNCKICGETNEADFYKENKSKCKHCLIIYAMNRAKKNPLRTREINRLAVRKYRQSHREAENARTRKYHQKCKEKNKISPPTYSIDFHKKCPKCQRDLPVSEFHKSVWRKDGLYSYCRDCNTIRMRLFRKTHRQLINENGRKSRIKYPERQRCRSKANYFIKGNELCSIKGCNRLGEKHHPDYNNPLQIIWLCRRHHRQICH